MNHKEEIKKAEELFEAGRIDEAEDIFSLVLQHQPDNYEILNNLGVIHYTRGNVEEAEACLLKVLAIKQDYPDALLNLSLLYMSVKRWEQAAGQLEKYISIDSKNADVFNQLGVIYLEMGNKEAAMSALARSLEIDPAQQMVKASLERIEEDRKPLKRGNAETVKNTFRSNMFYFHEPGLYNSNTNTQVGFKEDNISEKDHEIIKRIFDFWEAMKEASLKLCIEDNNDIWQTIRNRHHSELISILEKKNIARAKEFFASICKTDAIMGFMCHFQYNDLLNDQQKRQAEALHTLDVFCRLAESLGVLPVECPEQGHWGQNINSDINQIIVGIEKVLGFTVQVPQAGGGMFGLVTPKGILGRKDCIALYQAYRVASLLKNCFWAAITEIGGGAGFLMFHLFCNGFRNLKLYDLPQVAVIQSYFLTKSLPDAKIRLFGETKGDEQDNITILPYWEFRNSPPNSIKLVLNSDSFPEIKKEVTLQYLNDIKKSSELFLSFNQEGSEFMWETSHGKQSVVKDLIRDLGGFKRKYRFPFWMRRGYVEELYEVEI